MNATRIAVLAACSLRGRSAGSLLTLAAALLLVSATACSSDSSSGAGAGGPGFEIPVGLTVDEDTAGSFLITAIDSSGGVPEIEVNFDPSDAFTSLTVSEVTDGQALVEFTPATNRAGIVRVMVRLTTPGRTAEKMIRVALRPIPDDFTIVPIPDQTVLEGGSVSVPVAVQTLGGADEEGQPFDLAVRTLTGASIPESITIAGNVITINTTPDGNGVATFEVEVSRGGFVRTKTFALFITPINDPPQLTDPDARIVVVENSPVMSFDFAVVPGPDAFEQANQSVGFEGISAADAGAFAELSASLLPSNRELRVTLRPTPGFSGLTAVIVSLTDFLPGGQVDVMLPVEVTPELTPARLGPGPTVELAPTESAMVTIPILDRGDTAATPPLSADSPSPTVQVSGLNQTLTTVQFQVTASAGDGPAEVVIPVVLGAPGVAGVSSVRVRRRPSTPLLTNLTVNPGGGATARGQVRLQADLVQDLGLPVDLLVELERSPGAGFRRIRPSVVSRDLGGEGLLGRRASAAGRTWTFVFDSVEEYGLAQASGARLRVTPRLTDGGRDFAAPVGSAVGAAVTTSAFDIDNRPVLAAGSSLPGNTPTRILTAELDGDDAPELVALFPTELQVRSQTATGALTFGAATSFALPAAASELRAVAWGDSGRPALVLLLPSLDQLRIYRPDPSTAGAFLAPITRTVSGAAALDTGDFGGTGRRDLYVSDSGGITVFRQDPSLTEGLDTGDRTAVADFGAFAVGDLNSDGFDDVVVARPGLGQIHRLSRTPGGGAGFLTPALLFNGLGDQLRVRDVNGDDRVDIVRLEAASGTITVHRRANLVGFQFPVLATITAGAAAADFDTGNLDNRAPLDLVIRRADQTLVTARLSHSAAPIIEATGLSSALPVSLGDLDSDRSIDLVATGPSGLRLLLVDRPLAAPRRITGFFTRPNAFLPSIDLDGDGFEDLIERPLGVSWRTGGGQRYDGAEPVADSTAFRGFGDLDGDGRVDCARESGGTLFFHRGSDASPDGFLPAVSLPILNLPPGVFGVHLIGVYEGVAGERARLVVSADTISSGPLMVLGVDQNGQFFMEAVLFTRTSGARNAQLEVHDLDGDGLPDLILDGIGFLVVSKRRAGAAFAVEEPVQVPVSRVAGRLAVADVDGDGLLDLVGKAEGPSLRLVRQEPSRHGTFQAPIDFPVPDSLELVAAADVNDDGLAELFYATETEVFVRVGDSSAPGGLAAPVSLVSATPPVTFGSTFAVELRDLIGDPRPELIVNHRDRSGSETMSFIRVFRPGAAGALFDPPLVFSGTGVAPLEVRDLDGDGRLDIAASQSRLLQTDTGFQAERPAPLPFSNQFFGDIDAVDLTGDGRVELLISGDTGLQLLRPEDAAPFAYGRVQSLLGANSFTAEARVMDLGADGRLDVLLNDQDNGYRLTAIAIDEALATATSNTLIGSETAPQIFPLRRAGLSSPGFLLGSIAGNPINTLPIFSADTIGAIVRDGAFTPGAGVRETLVADLNRDGLDDIVFDTFQNTQIWLQGASGTFALSQTLPYRTRSLQVALIDDDDLVDLVYVRDLPTDLLVVQLNQPGSPGTFAAPIEASAPTPSGNQASFNGVFAVDLTGDRRAEVITGTLELRGVSIYSHGAGSQGAPLDNIERLRLARPPMKVLAWDSDGDGLPEPVMEIDNGIYHLVRGPDGRFNRRIELGFPTFLPNRDVFEVGDVDGDGRDELIVGTESRLIIIGGGRD